MMIGDDFSTPIIRRKSFEEIGTESDEANDPRRVVIEEIFSLKIKSLKSQQSARIGHRRILIISIYLKTRTFERMIAN